MKKYKVWVKVEKELTEEDLKGIECHVKEHLLDGNKITLARNLTFEEALKVKPRVYKVTSIYGWFNGNWSWITDVYWDSGNKVKELELESRLYDLRNDLTALSKKYEKARDQQKIYNRGVKNGIDLAIVKLNKTLGIYEKTEKGSKTE